MRKFWGFYDNGTYRIGCSGGTIYVYDQTDNELAKFRDIRYVYRGAFQPGKNIFLAKSTEGLLAVYDLDKMTLIKKISITRKNPQDEGFAFTPDGAYFYNIEQPIIDTQTRLTIYRTTDFDVHKILFQDEKYLFFQHVEFDPETETCYVLGYTRNHTFGGFSGGFVGILTDSMLVERKPIDGSEYHYINACIDWRTMGFTKKSLEWSWFKYNHVDPVCDVTLKSVYEQA